MGRCSCAGLGEECCVNTDGDCPSSSCDCCQGHCTQPGGIVGVCQNKKPMYACQAITKGCNVTTRRNIASTLSTIASRSQSARHCAPPVRPTCTEKNRTESALVKYKYNIIPLTELKQNRRGENRHSYREKVTMRLAAALLCR